jgi:hypothetical protein
MDTESVWGLRKTPTTTRLKISPAPRQRNECQWFPTNWASHNVVSIGSLGIISAALAGDTKIKKE